MVVTILFMDQKARPIHTYTAGSEGSGSVSEKVFIWGPKKGADDWWNSLLGAPASGRSSPQQHFFWVTEGSFPSPASSFSGLVLVGLCSCENTAFVGSGGWITTALLHRFSPY